MKSANFEILRGGWPELAELGGFAEAYAHADPASALVKLRLFAENLTKDIYRDLLLPKPDQPTFVDLLRNEAFSSITPRVVLDKIHARAFTAIKPRMVRRPNPKTPSGF
jgi:type I restriction enzyme, R subunit